MAYVMRADYQSAQKSPLRPVLGSSGALGHVLFSCRGYRAFDRNDVELGMFDEPSDAVLAILTAASTKEGQACQI